MDPWRLLVCRQTLLWPRWKCEEALHGESLRLQRLGALLHQILLAQVLLASNIPILQEMVLFLEYSLSCPHLVSEEAEAETKPL